MNFNVPLSILYSENYWRDTSITLAARGWAGGTSCCANYPDFFENNQFRVIYCVTLAYVLFSEEFLIHDSRGFVLLKNN